MIESALESGLSPCERFQRVASMWLRSGETARTTHLLSPLEELAGFNYGFVYLLHVDERSVKIGFSENPRRRIRELWATYGDRLRIVNCFAGEPAAEREAHRRFAHLRMENERFCASPAIVRYFAERRTEVREHLKEMHLCAPTCPQLVGDLDLRMLSSWLRR